MIQIKIFTFNPFQENTYVLYDETKEAVIIDAGCYSLKEEELLDNFITEKGLKPVHLLNTHCHIDHILGNRYVAEFYKLIPEAHKADEFLSEAAKSYGASFGIKTDTPPAIGKYLEEGMQIHFGNSILDILHVPGHSPGSLVFLNKTENFMVVGDVLFDGSIGRSDLPGGNHQQLISNIKTKLLTQAESTIVYSGHGPSTTIGKEKRTNPFLV